MCSNLIAPGDLYLCRVTEFKLRYIGFVMKTLVQTARLFLAIMVLLAIPSLVFAQGPIEKDLKIYQVKEVADQQGMEETLIEVDTPVPGSVHEYKFIYRNISGKSLDGIVIRQSIPANSFYMWGSATAPEGTDLYLSMDNGNTFHPVSSINDSVEEIDSTKEHKFKALQWVVKRSPEANEILALSYRAISK